MICEAKPLWWSFYESDAHFENFMIRALAYSRMDAAHLPDDDLDEKTANVIVGSTGDSPVPLGDPPSGTSEAVVTGGGVTDFRSRPDIPVGGSPTGTGESPVRPADIRETCLEKHRLRQCADPRAGRFLRRLALVRASRVLISTRLYPAELQTQTAQPLPGCHAAFLTGLPDDDALNLWRALGVTGTREQLLPLCNAFGNYPLLLRALAGEVADFLPAPGNFDQWRAANPGFNPAGLPLKNAKTHVLEFALRGLGETQRRVLHTIAAFRMPATWETLRTLLVEIDSAAPLNPLPLRATCLRAPHRQRHERGEGQLSEQRPSSPQPSPPSAGGEGARAGSETGAPKPCRDDRELNAMLTELEDRGLVGWDKQANRYDLHPLVRTVVWGGLHMESKQSIHKTLRLYFEPLAFMQEESVRGIDDLTPVIEHYNALVGLRMYDEACDLLISNVSAVEDTPGKLGILDKSLHRLGHYIQRIELLKMLFPEEKIEKAPLVTEPYRQAFVYNSLALAYDPSGQPGVAVGLFQRGISISDEFRLAQTEIRTRIVVNLSSALRHCGRLRESQREGIEGFVSSRERHDLFWEVYALCWLGMTLGARGRLAGFSANPVAAFRSKPLDYHR